MKQYETNRQGSILIWTVAIGMALTTAFFFLAVRLGLIRDTQRENMVYHSQKAYLESYVVYLEQKLPRVEGPIDFDADPDGNPIIRGSIIQVDTIEGFLDAGQEEIKDVSGADIGNVTVYWNYCGQESGDLMIDGTVYSHDPAACATADYDDGQLVGPDPGSVTLRAVNTPVHYRIAHDGAGKFSQASWTIEASVDLDQYGRKITVTRTVE